MFSLARLSISGGFRHRYDTVGIITSGPLWWDQQDRLVAEEPNELSQPESKCYSALVWFFRRVGLYAQETTNYDARDRKNRFSTERWII